MKPALRQLLFSQWTPAKLFLNSTPGDEWSDPWDLSTQYQDSAGTTAGAIAQAVGLSLDKSRGAVRGANVAVNGGFDADLTGWVAGTGGWAWNAGTAKLTGDGTAQSLVQASVTSGQWYEVTWDVVITSGAGIALFTNSGATNVLNAATTGSYRAIFQAVGTGLEFKRSSGIVVGSIDNVVARPIPGNHLLQATTASRPRLEQDASGRLHHLFDGVDDSFTSATGGGGSTGFLFCAAITVNGGAATARTLWSDAGANTGYRVRVNASNQLEIAAGNGVAFTTLATVATLPVGETHVVTVWDDGVSLKAQIDQGAIASAARPAVVGGTAGFTVGKDNGAATSFLPAKIYARVDRQSDCGDVQRARLQRYMATRAGITL